MKTILATTIGALAMATLAPPATAADMPVKAVYKAPTVDPWNGVYVGLNVGYSWGRSNTNESVIDLSGFAVGGPLRFTGNQIAKMPGVIGGGQIGVNWQVANFLLGLEADIQASGQRGSSSFFCVITACDPLAESPDPNAGSTGTLNQRLTWFGTARARGGLLFTPSTLLYVTGGLAVGQIKSDGVFTGLTQLPVVVPTSVSFSNSVTKTGWTIGGGFETRLTTCLSAKIEYLYIDLGTVTTSVTNLLIPSRLDYSSRITDNIVRVGINYRFGDTVVASY